MSCWLAKHGMLGVNKYMGKLDSYHKYYGDLKRHFEKAKLTDFDKHKITVLNQFYTNMKITET